MDKAWKIEQLGKISAQTSVFKYIPKEIGDVLYCDTDKSDSEPLDAESAKRKKVVAFSICFVVLILYWSFFYSYYIWGAIITLLAIAIAGTSSDSAFYGTDYFVGDKGFATVSFMKTRDNITSEKIYLFKDFEYFFTGECINKINYSYNNTSYYFSIFGKYDPITNQYHRIFYSKGYYSDKQPADPMNPCGAKEEYCMLKKVEQVWTTFFVLSHADKEYVNFGILKDEALFSDAIAISSHEIIIDDTVYNSSNTKRIYASKGNLIVENVNHAKKLFGLIERGDTSSIPLSSLGNKQAFLIFLNRLYKG